MNTVNRIKPYMFLDGVLAFLVARGVPAFREGPANAEGWDTLLVGGVDLG